MGNSRNKKKKTAIFISTYHLIFTFIIQRQNGIRWKPILKWVSIQFHHLKVKLDSWLQYPSLHFLFLNDHYHPRPNPLLCILPHLLCHSSVLLILIQIVFSKFEPAPTLVPLPSTSRRSSAFLPCRAIFAAWSVGTPSKLVERMDASAEPYWESLRLFGFGERRALIKSLRISEMSERSLGLGYGKVIRRRMLFGIKQG